MIMFDWREKANDLFPELRASIANADTPYLLWTELLLAFNRAYDTDDVSLIRRIYEYARWCSAQPRGETAENDLPTCVAVSFFEHVPQHAKALEDVPRWFTRQEVEAMRDTLSYYVGSDGFERILNQF